MRPKSALTKERKNSRRKIKENVEEVGKGRRKRSRGLELKQWKTKYDEIEVNSGRVEG